MMLADLTDVLLWNTLVASVAILLVLVLRTPIRNRFGARVGYLLWSIVPVVMIASMLPASEQVVSMQNLAFDVAPVRLMPAVNAEAIVTRELFDMRPLLLLVWGVGGVIFALAMILQQRRFIGALGTLHDDGAGIHYAENAASSPALIGLFSPRIVVPSNFDASYDKTERELILRHERIHRDRGDHWFNALVAMGRCVFWFNPLIHAAAAAFRQDQELACDALVVAANPKSRRVYASAMLKAGFQAAPLPVGCQWQSAHPLKERVLMLQKNEVGSGRRRAGNVIFALVAASASFAAWALQPATATQRIEVELQFTGEAGDKAAVKRAVLNPDELFTIEVGQGARTKTLEIAFRPVSSGVIAGKGVVRVGGKITSTPQILFEDGKPVSMSIEDDNNGEVAAPAKRWEINVTARVLNRPPESHAGRVKSEAQISAGVDAMPQYARLKPPLYPRDSSGEKMTGTVYLSVRVGRDGSPIEVKRIEGGSESQASDALAHAAITAVRTWTFDPAVHNGEKVEAEVVVPITFGSNESSSAQSIPAGVGNVLDAINVNQP